MLGHNRAEDSFVGMGQVRCVDGGNPRELFNESELDRNLFACPRNFILKISSSKFGVGNRSKSAFSTGSNVSVLVRNAAGAQGGGPWGGGQGACQVGIWD